MKNVIEKILVAIAMVVAFTVLCGGLYWLYLIAELKWRG